VKRKREEIPELIPRSNQDLRFRVEAA